MTKAQKETLRDLFEGCFTFEQAVLMAGIQDMAAYHDAKSTWRRWEREMDEHGSYTF